MNQRIIENREENRDPISGAKGAHPVGTGLGAVAGGAAAGAAIGSIAGPIGTAAGVVGGAIVGGLAGKAVAEAVDPTLEDAYWRENYSSRSYILPNKSYGEYEGAFRTGYEGYGRFAPKGKRFEDVESELRSSYEKNRQSLPWDNARHAARDAWHRLERNVDRLIGYTVLDLGDDRIGTVESVWEDHTGQPAFLGIRTGWLGMGRQHVVPAESAQVNESSRRIRLPFPSEVVKNAPSYDEQSDINENSEREIHDYYQKNGLQRRVTGTESEVAPLKNTPPEATAETRVNTRRTDDKGQQSMRLKEEKVHIGKREVDAGGVRLRKVIRTEIVNQPVELSREEIVIERIPANESDIGDSKFEEREIYIPLRQEEVVVVKDAKIREQIKVGKKVETERRDVSETVRKEEVEIENTTATPTRSIKSPRRMIDKLRVTDKLRE